MGSEGDRSGAREAKESKRKRREAKGRKESEGK